MNSKLGGVANRKHVISGKAAVAVGRWTGGPVDQ